MKKRGRMQFIENTAGVMRFVLCAVCYCVYCAVHHWTVRINMLVSSLCSAAVADVVSGWCWRPADDATN